MYLFQKKVKCELEGIRLRKQNVYRIKVLCWLAYIPVVISSSV